MWSSSRSQGYDTNLIRAPTRGRQRGPTLRKRLRVNVKSGRYELSIATTNQQERSRQVDHGDAFPSLAGVAEILRVNKLTGGMPCGEFGPAAHGAPFRSRPYPRDSVLWTAPFRFRQPADA